MEIVASAPNSTHVDRLRTAIVERGLPSHAAAWLLRALHPPAETTGTHQVPDCCSRPSVPICYRETATYSGTFTSVSVGADWDMMIVTTPGDNVAATIVTGPAGIDFSAPNPPGVRSVILTFQDDASLSTAPVVRVDRLASAENPSTGVWFANNASGFMSFRHVFTSVTSYMTASDMFNSGTVTAGQLDGAAAEGEGVMSNVPAQYPATLVKRFRVPLTEADLVETVVGARVAPAKEGVFMPIRMFGGNFPYVDKQRVDGKTLTVIPLGVWPPSSVPGVTYLIPPAPVGTLGDTGASYVPVFTGGGGASRDIAAGLAAVATRLGATYEPSPFGDVGYTNSNCSVTIYRGLNYNASITVKLLAGLEAIPSARSPIRSMSQPGAAPSPEAIEAYFTMSKLLPLALPARDNSAGLLLSKIMSFLPIVLPRVTRAVEALIGDPAPPARSPVKSAAPPRGKAAKRLKRTAAAAK